MEAALKHAIIAALAALCLSACGPAPSEPSSTQENAAGGTAAAGDPCAILSDPSALFGRAVTAAREPMSNMCQWRSADATVTGSIIVHGAGWSAVADAAQTYRQMLEPIAQLGEARPVEGLGEEAVIVASTGQAQVFFRKNAVAVNVGASSSDPALTSAALAERIARAAADRL